MPSPIMERLAKRVRLLRLKRGWDQVDLAVHAEMSRQHVSAIELGQREICLKALERLANALEVEPADLISINGPKK